MRTAIYFARVNDFRRTAWSFESRRGLIEVAESGTA